MANLTARQIYAIQIQAGFNPVQAVTATAIALAESAGNPNAIGDVNNPHPGSKSVGLMQINYDPTRDTGTRAAYRDPTANLDPLTNARAAYAISSAGRNFGPWSTFTSGAYARNLDVAKSAAKSYNPKFDASGVAAPILPRSAGKAGVFTPAEQAASPTLTPIGKAIVNPAGALQSLFAGAVAKPLTVGVAIVFGLVLVGIGVTRATGTQSVATKALTKGLV